MQCIYRDYGKVGVEVQKKVRVESKPKPAKPKEKEEEGDWETVTKKTAGQMTKQV